MRAGLYGRSNKATKHQECSCQGKGPSEVTHCARRAAEAKMRRKGGVLPDTHPVGAGGWGEVSEAANKAGDIGARWAGAWEAAVECR